MEQGIKELETGEQWLVMPRRVGDNQCLYRPGIKWNVQPGSFTHRTELFGPVLGVMPFGRLEQAIEIVNATGYGLTSGLESLDDREQQLWRDTIHAGNLYINRPTTGAIVLRQPFGGIGSSGYGPGAKAGGPHYVLPLMNIHKNTQNHHPTHERVSVVSSTANEPSSVSDALNSILAINGSEIELDISRLTQFANAASQVASDLFDKLHDHVNLIGQDNQRRYLPVRQLRIRLIGDESVDDVAISMLAAAAADCHATYSLATVTHPAGPLVDAFCEYLAFNAITPWQCEWIEESDESLAEEISVGRVDRLRLLTPTKIVSAALHDVCRDSFTTIVAEPIVDDAEIESLRYLNEQSISYDYHRYGNLGRR